MSHLLNLPDFCEKKLLFDDRRLKKTSTEYGLTNRCVSIVQYPTCICTE